MNNQNTNTTPSSDTFASTKEYFGRVANNEAAKKGIAAAGAGLLVAAITELLWPSR